MNKILQECLIVIIFILPERLFKCSFNMKYRNSCQGVKLVTK